MLMTRTDSHIGKRTALALFWALCCCIASPLAAATYGVAQVPNVQTADRSRYTSNPDGILSDGAVRHIDRICDSLRREGLAQVAVVALDDIDSDDTFDFAVRLFRSWGVGRAQIDNGVGILLVLDRREIRFVTGGGVEGVLPDALCKRIQMQRMLPLFSRGDYDGGMVAGVEAVAQLLRSGELDFGPEEDDEPVGVLVAVVLITILGFAAVAWLAYRQQTRCPKCGKPALRGAGVRSTKNYIEKSYVCAECGHRLVRRYAKFDDNSLGGGPYIGGGSFLGGGGGSFGGGSFGGGGAGSRW